MHWVVVDLPIAKATILMFSKKAKQISLPSSVMALVMITSVISNA